MDSESQLHILKLIQDINMPVGAVYLSEKAKLPQATVGRVLLELEKDGYLQKVSNKGRLLTERGVTYIAQKQQLYDKLKTAHSIIETVESTSKHKLCEVLEVRIALESISARRACENITAQDMAELDTILLEHIYELKRGGIGSDQDLKIHMKIAELSGNQTLAQLLGLILTQENTYTKFSIVSPHITSVQIKQHSAIIEAIRAKDGTRAMNAMVTHLKEVMENLRQYYTRNESQ